MLNKDFIDVHSDEEITDEDAIEFKDEDVVAIEYESQVKHFSLLREQSVE
jgi:hypothetical protein